MNEAQILLAQMNSEELDLLILRLGRYARLESQRLSWRTGSSEDLPGGETDESIVSKAFERVLSGNRRWNSQDDPDFAKYMMDVIDSLLSHLFESKDNTMFGPPPEDGSKDETAWHGASPKHKRNPEQNAEWMMQTITSPEEELIQKEQKATEKRAVELLRESIIKDTELNEILEAIQQGCDKNGEISKMTGIDIRDVENAKKRFKRKIAAVNEQIMNSENQEHKLKQRSNDNGRK